MPKSASPLRLAQDCVPAIRGRASGCVKNGPIDATCRFGAEVTQRHRCAAEAVGAEGSPLRSIAWLSTISVYAKVGVHEERVWHARRAGMSRCTHGGVYMMNMASGEEGGEAL